MVMNKSVLASDLGTIKITEVRNVAGSTGFEPAISSVTGRRDNHFTTSPRFTTSTKLILPKSGKSFDLALSVVL